MEFGDGFGCSGFDRVGDSEDSREFAIYGNEHRGLTFILKFHDRCFKRLEASYLLVPQEVRLSDHHRAAGDGAGNTARRHRAKVFHGIESDTSLLRALDNRGGERVFAVLLQRRGETQEFLRVETADGQDIHEPGLALGEGARLVHDERGDLLQPFERLGVFHEHAFLRAASDADHDGHGSGQAEGARAGDDEDRDGVDDGVGELGLRSKPHPQDEGEHRNSQYRRHEDSRDLVGEALNGRATALGLGYHVHDLPEQRVATDSLGAHDETAGAIDGAAGHLVADGLFHRERFAGDHGLFHAGVTFDHRAIHGHPVTRNDAQANRRLSPGRAGLHDRPLVRPAARWAARGSATL